MSSGNQPKHALNVYTVMLITSTLLMLGACVMMYIEWSRAS
ncbi:MAG: hypothetical protein AAF483_00065 [Planctomycetota bacterium]